MVSSKPEKSDFPACSALFIVLIALSCLSASCSVKRVEIPPHEEANLKEEIARKGKIKSIESVFSIEFKKNGSPEDGDAVLRLSPDNFDLQVYSHGLLAADIRTIDNEIKSIPLLSRIVLRMLVDGLRSSFFWWSMEEYNVRDEGGKFIISNSARTVLLNRKTLMPEEQAVEVEERWLIKVFYDEPKLFENVMFPSGMRIELANQSVKLRIETLSITDY